MSYRIVTGDVLVALTTAWHGHDYIERLKFKSMVSGRPLRDELTRMLAKKEGE